MEANKVYTSLTLFTLLCRNHFGETPVDSAFKSGRKELIDLLDLDKEGLLPSSADDPKLPTLIMEVRRFTQHIIQTVGNILIICN